MTLECGIRFLTDYLDGDNYFYIHYPERNLDRCPTQFKLVKDMEEQFGAIHAVVDKYSCNLYVNSLWKNIKTKFQPSI